MIAITNLFLKLIRVLQNRSLPRATRLIGAGFIALFTVGTVNCRSAELLTNATHMEDAPKWMTLGRVDKVVDHIQMVLEWDIHRVEVYWYSDQAKFEKMHGLGRTVLALSKLKENSIHLGPRVTQETFDEIFCHELVHIISFQKYKGAIPKWLEEGLANHLAKAKKVDYAWLAQKPFPTDVRDLTHPFSGSEDNIRYHYIASQALAEMIATKCPFKNLLQMSVGRKMEDYLDTYCEIKDLNSAYKKWVTAQTADLKIKK